MTWPLPERLLFASQPGAMHKGAVVTAAASVMPRTGETVLGTSTCGNESLSARRWVRWMGRGSKDPSRTRNGKKTEKRSKS